MSGIRYYLFVPKITASNTGAVKNDGGVPSILSGLDGSKPAPGVIGRIYIATDTKWIYRDNGITWELLGTNAITVNNIPVGILQPTASDQIKDQIVVTPADEIKNRLYNFIPLISRGELVNTIISNSNDMAIRGNYMYLTVSDKVVVLDISNPAYIAIVGSLNYNGAFRLDLQGSYLYVTSRPNRTVACIDISDPSIPSLTWSINISTNPSYYVSDVIAFGSYLYVTFTDTSPVGYDYEYLGIYDINTRNLISTVELNINYSALFQYQPIAINGNYLYVNSGGYISIYDVTNKSSPVYKNRVSSMDSVMFMKIQGSYLYAAGYPKMSVYDITNPANPVYKGEFNVLKNFFGMDIAGNYAYLTSRGTSDGTVYEVDISNPVLPELVKSFASTNLLNASVIGVRENHIYVVADGTNKIIAFG